MINDQTKALAELVAECRRADKQAVNEVRRGFIHPSIVERAEAALAEGVAHPTAAPAGVSELDAIRQRHLDTLADVLDAKEAMLAIGIAQNDFPSMFSALLKLVPPSPPQSEPSDEQVAMLDPWMRPEAARELLREVLASEPNESAIPVPSELAKPAHGAAKEPVLTEALATVDRIVRELEVEEWVGWSEDLRAAHTAIAAVLKQAGVAQPAPTPGVETRGELSEQEQIELLDWVSTCQSSYAMAQPGHRFAKEPNFLEANRAGLVEYVNQLFRKPYAPTPAGVPQEPVTWKEGDPIAPPKRSERERLQPAPAVGVLSQAAKDVLAERQRQISVEGWTAEHDDQHLTAYKEPEMAIAAACYAMVGVLKPEDIVNTWWPWSPECWKPTTPRRNRVKACALLLAEIERFDRAEVAAGANS